jgi:biotin synthase-related radical SAM superfamily protein
MSEKTIGIRKPRVRLSEVTEQDAILEVHHQDSITFIEAFVPVPHRQMEKIVKAWFDNFPKQEQVRFLAELQKIIDLS